MLLMLFPILPFLDSTGDWAVAGCVLRRDWRDIIRRVLGPHILLLNLTMSEQAREKRLLQRHQDDQREVRFLKVRLRTSCKKFIKFML